MLKDCVDVAINNKECVVLKVKPNKQMDLIALGCFYGDETMIRVTKGDINYTVWRENEKPFSWSTATLVSNSVEMKAKTIRNCIYSDFGILLR